jgi:hypothetical protein
MQSCTLWCGAREKKPKRTKIDLSCRCVESHSHHQDGDVLSSQGYSYSQDHIVVVILTMYMHDYLLATQSCDLRWVCPHTLLHHFETSLQHQRSHGRPSTYWCNSQMGSLLNSNRSQSILRNYRSLSHFHPKFCSLCCSPNSTHLQRHPLQIQRQANCSTKWPQRCLTHPQHPSSYWSTPHILLWASFMTLKILEDTTIADSGQ